MGAVDVGGRDVHHVAAVEQEIDDLSSLARIVGPQRSDDVSARFEDSLPRWRVLAIRGSFERGARLADVGMEKHLLWFPQQQSLARSSPVAAADRRQQAQVRRLAVLRIEVAQGAEQDSERGQPLQTVDHIENSAGAGPRPARAPRGRALTLDEQHRAQEMIGAIDR